MKHSVNDAPFPLRLLSASQSSLPGLFLAVQRDVNFASCTMQRQVTSTQTFKHPSEMCLLCPVDLRHAASSHKTEMSGAGAAPRGSTLALPVSRDGQVNPGSLELPPGEE